MSEWDDNTNAESDSGLTEMEQLQMDRVTLDVAYNNAYLILSKQVTFDDLMASHFKNGDDAIMAFDPEKGPTQDELENMIEHFIDTEEYEKCAELNRVRNKAYPLTIFEA